MIITTRLFEPPPQQEPGALAKGYSWSHVDDVVAVSSLKLNSDVVPWFEDDGVTPEGWYSWLTRSASLVRIRVVVPSITNIINTDMVRTGMKKSGALGSILRLASSEGMALV